MARIFGEQGTGDSPRKNVGLRRDRGMDRLGRVGGTGLPITDGRGATFWFKKFLERDREKQALEAVRRQLGIIAAAISQSRWPCKPVNSLF